MEKRGVRGGSLTLAAALIQQAKKDLKSEDSYDALRAAKYFFLKPTEEDSGDLKTFAGLCLATNIDADAGAKAIFDELSPCQQTRIRLLLQDAGYKTVPEKSHGLAS